MGEQEAALCKEAKDIAHVEFIGLVGQLLLWCASVICLPCQVFGHYSYHLIVFPVACQLGRTATRIPIDSNVQDFCLFSQAGKIIRIGIRERIPIEPLVISSLMTHICRLAGQIFLRPWNLHVVTLIILLGNVPADMEIATQSSPVGNQVVRQYLCKTI